MLNDYISLGMEYWQIWLIFAIVLFIMELITPSFLLACFAVAALFAAISSLFDLGLGFDLLIFAVFSLLSLYYLRPFMLKISKKPEHKTGMDALLGKEVRVIEDIDNNDGKGLVLSDSDQWRAISRSGECIKKGTIVRIISYDSLVLCVEEVKKL